MIVLLELNKYFELVSKFNAVIAVLEAFHLLINFKIKRLKSLNCSFKFTYVLILASISDHSTINPSSEHEYKESLNCGHQQISFTLSE